MRPSARKRQNIHYFCRYRRLGCLSRMPRTPKIIEKKQIFPENFPRLREKSYLCSPIIPWGRS